MSTQALVEDIQRKLAFVKDTGARQALLQELNHFQSATRFLPPEVLATIFEHTRPPLDPPFHNFHDEYHTLKSLLTLTHVCSQWRQVAWSAPQLWSIIILSLNEGNLDGLLELHLRNSGGFPLHLKLTSFFSGARASPPLNDNDNTIQRLLLNPRFSHRIQTLHLSSAPTRWLHLIASSFPQLQSLTLLFPTYVDIALGTLGHLRHVHLAFHRGNIMLPWASITELELIGAPFDDCVKMLISCPSLVQFRSSGPTEVREAAIDPFITNSIITLPHLEVLLWTPHPCGHAYLDAFQQLRLHSLRRLSWITDIHVPELVESQVEAFFSNLPDTLRDLQIGAYGGLSFDSFRHIFSETQSTREFTYICSESGEVAEVLRALCPPVDNESVERLGLPSLVSLKIYDYVEDEPTDKVSELILEVCKRQLREPVDKFRIWFPDSEVSLAEEVREELCDMVRQGFDLEIEDTSGRVVP